MDDRGVMAVEVEKAAKNLPTPVLHCPDIDPSMLLPIPIHTLYDDLA